jgi:hypothetical protein
VEEYGADWIRLEGRHTSGQGHAGQWLNYLIFILIRDAHKLYLKLK